MYAPGSRNTFESTSVAGAERAKAATAERAKAATAERAKKAKTARAKAKAAKAVRAKAARAKAKAKVVAASLFQSSSCSSLAIHHTNEYTGIASNAITPTYTYHGIETRSDMILE